MLNHVFPAYQCFTEQGVSGDGALEVGWQLDSVRVRLGASRQLSGCTRRLGDITYLLSACVARRQDVDLRHGICGGVPSDLLFEPLPIIVVAEPWVVAIVDLCAGETPSVWRPSVDNPALTSTYSENIDVRPNKRCE